MIGWPSVTSPNWRGECGLLLGGELLVPEEQDVVAVEGLAQRPHDVVGQRGRQVEAADLGTDHR